MARGQGQGTIPVPVVDPVDLLVPPPRPLWRSVVASVAVALLLGGGVALWSSGLVRPRLQAVTGFSEWREASTTFTPALSFWVRNAGHVPLVVDGVDARAPGLGRPSVTVTDTPYGGKDTRPLRGPVRLEPGRQVQVTIAFATWDCRRIETNGSDTVPVHVHGPLGIATTVSLVPGGPIDPPGSPVAFSGSGPNGIGWAAAITWTACHPGPGAPVAR